MNKVDKYLEDCKIEDFEIENYDGEPVNLSQLIESFYLENVKDEWLDIEDFTPWDNQKITIKFEGFTDDIRYSKNVTNFKYWKRYKKG